MHLMFLQRQNIPFHWQMKIWSMHSELFLTKFYLLPAQSIELVTAAWFLTLSITAYSQLFRRHLQCYNMKLKRCSLVCLSGLWRGSGLSIGQS